MAGIRKERHRGEDGNSQKGIEAQDSHAKIGNGYDSLDLPELEMNAAQTADAGGCRRCQTDKNEQPDQAFDQAFDFEWTIEEIFSQVPSKPSGKTENIKSDDQEAKDIAKYLFDSHNWRPNSLLESMNIYSVEEQFGDDGIGILVPGIGIQYFKFQRPVGRR